MTLLVNAQGATLGRYLIDASIWCIEHADLYGRESVVAFANWWTHQQGTGMCPLHMTTADWTYAFLTWRSTTLI